MEIVINTSYGGISEASAAKRLDPQFIEDVEMGRFVGYVDEKYGIAETLRVVEIPDDVTDYRIVNYDGCELVIYVHNGMICYGPVDSDATCIFTGHY